MSELSSKKVLIVEDESFLKDLLSMKFSSEGVDLVHADDGEEALKRAREEKPDVILLDLVLPDMNGFDVLKKVKTDPETASIPVVVLSNLGQEGDVEKGKTLGADEFLIKANFSLDEVIVKVRAVLAKTT